MLSEEQEEKTGISAFQRRLSDVQTVYLPLNSFSASSRKKVIAYCHAIKCMNLNVCVHGGWQICTISDLKPV